jgi:uncharacterized membrane protein
MNAADVLGLVSLFISGILAGEEFVIYYGVRSPIASLDERPQIQSRQALILRLRVLVPAVFMPSALLGVGVTASDGFGPGFIFRCAGLLALLTWGLATLPGTVPINSAILGWDPNAPPKDWRELVKKWERFAVVRCWAAMAAFALFLTAMAV